MTSPDICKATTRSKGRLLICDRPLHHDGVHRQDGHNGTRAVVWPQEGPLPGDEKVIRL